MSSQRRNVVVGLVVLIALGVLVWMILMFAGEVTSLFSPSGLKVTMFADRADGVSDGAAVFYRGVNVGKVNTVSRESDNKTVRISAEIDRNPPLPKNLVGVIRFTSALSSNASIYLELEGEPEGQLATGATLKLMFKGLSILPEEFTGLANEVRQQQLVHHVDQTVVTIREEAEKAGKVLESVNQLIADPRMREDIRVAIANIRTTTESANRIGAKMEKLSDKLDAVADNTNATVTEVRTAVHQSGKNLDDLARQLTDSSQKLGSTLDQFRTAAEKINQGKGTAGLLINDPKLYESLVDVSHTLNATVLDLQRVVEQWEKEGVSLKLK